MRIGLTPEQRQKFPSLAPDFVIELRSATDELKPLHALMQEYKDNGVRLGWLIDRGTNVLKFIDLERM